MKIRLEKIKTHFRENKKFYIGVGVGLAVAAVGVLIFKSTKVSMTNDSYKIEVFKWKSPTTNNIVQNTILERRGHPGNIVRCIETGDEWASQAYAAAEEGISATTLVRHLNGVRDHVNGKHYERMGEAVSQELQRL